MEEPQDPIDDELDRLLRAARPAPSDRYVAATERRLLGRPVAGRRGRRRLLGALGLSSALAATLVIAGLAGSGPLAPGGDTPSQAGDRCHTVRVKRVEQVGTLVIRDGKPVVVKQPRVVTREVKRCR